MLGDRYAGRAPGQPYCTGCFGDWNAQEIRDGGVADAFLVRLRRPGAAQIDARLRVERTGILRQGSGRWTRPAKIRINKYLFSHDLILLAEAIKLR